MAFETQDRAVAVVEYVEAAGRQLFGGQWHRYPGSSGVDQVRKYRPVRAENGGFTVGEQALHEGPDGPHLVSWFG